MSQKPSTSTSIHPASVSQRVAVVFPGQGSQSVEMLSELHAIYPIIDKTFNEASEVLGFDLWAVCHNEKQLAQTQNTQPALLTASMAIWYLLDDLIAGGLTALNPLYLAGHSLGEYSALCAAGSLSFADAVSLVYARGQAMQAAVESVDSKMVAVLGLDDTQIQSLCEQVESELGDVVVSPANFNSPGQVVVAGDTRGVDALMISIKALGKRTVPLKVSVPSHCRLMDAAAAALARKLESTHFQLLKIDVIQNINAQTAPTITEIKNNLTQQLSHPVQWQQTMQKLADKHINLIVECGAGTVLSNLAKRQQTPIITYPTDKPERLAKLIEVLS